MSDQDSPEQQPVEIEDPNINDSKQLDEWLERYVQKPFQGFEDKKHPDGTPYSLEEQIKESRNQLKTLAEEWPQIGMKKADIIKGLKEGVVGLQKEPEADHFKT